MTGQSRVCCHSGSIRISDLSDHDNVRVLSQDASQTFSKSKTDFRANLTLVDTGNFIFDRIFQRYNIDTRLIYSI
ncbi:MAG: hypothetical protein BWX77_00058 [Bacteroidetes bacterium ADurb.Bin090]|nr:MAG: hypothetical protein BWX77_00058 [Bacteroidetes bacterium ADurb.Bin090]